MIRGTVYPFCHQLGASLFDRTTDHKQSDKISPRTNGTFGFARNLWSFYKTKRHYPQNPSTFRKGSVAIGHNSIGDKIQQAQSSPIILEF